MTYGFDACTDTGTFAFSFLANGTLSFHWWSEDADYVSSGILRVADPDGGDGSTTSDLPSDTSQLDLTKIMPMPDDVPPGLVVIDDQRRTLEQSSQVYSNPGDMRTRFEDWRWRTNALRVFGVPDGASAAPESTTLVAVSMHAFGSAEAASQALDYALNDEMSVFGHQEIVLAPVGDRSRTIKGRTETGNETLVYTQRGTVLVVVSASSPSGNATADAMAIANAIVRNLDESCPGC
jgi:hypothetical protein